MPIPRPSFTKRPPAEPEAKPSPKTEAREKRAPEPEEPWEPILGEDVSDSLLGLCEVLEENIGPEWKLETDKAKRIGERWARLGNRLARRARNRLILQALVYGLVFFACVEFFAFFAGRTVRTLRRRRKEAEAAKTAKHTVPGRVLPFDDEKEASGGT